MRAYKSLWVLLASGLLLGCPIIIPPEDCDNGDDDDLDGRVDCLDSDCRFAPVCNPDECGNNIINPGEECDGTNVGGFDCQDFGYNAGTLRCDAFCEFDTGFCYNAELCQNGVDDDDDGFIDCLDADCQGQPACSDCGDGIIDPGEECDGANLGGYDCQDFGFNSGTLFCDAFCDFDTSACFDVEICNNFIDDDGDGFTDCEDLDCYSLPICPRCGDGTTNPGEQCDDGNNNNDDGCSATCQLEYGFCQSVMAHGPGRIAFASNDDIGSTDEINLYGCSNWLETGPEFAFLLVAASTETITASLSGMTADLDIFIIEDQGDFICDSRYSCLAYADESVSWQAQLGRHYFIVVDGYGGAVSDFTLLINDATPSVCGNGILETDEECDDGNNQGGDGCANYCELEAGSCNDAWTLICNSSDTWNNGGSSSTDVVNRYGCTTWDESGPEYTYQFTAPADGTIEVTLSGLNTDLDIFVLLEAGFGCSAGNCVGYGDGQATVQVEEGTIYYLIVDGYGGAQGNYTISLDCFF